MAFEWLNKIVIKIASEVHKNKIEDFEKRILVIEQEEKVITLETKYKDNKDIIFLDGKGWNADLHNRRTRVHIKITSQNDGDMKDDRQIQDFYDIFKVLNKLNVKIEEEK